MRWQESKRRGNVLNWNTRFQHSGRFHPLKSTEAEHDCNRMGDPGFLSVSLCVFVLVLMWRLSHKHLLGDMWKLEETSSQENVRILELPRGCMLEWRITWKTSHFRDRWIRSLWCASLVKDKVSQLSMPFILLIENENNCGWIVL